MQVSILRKSEVISENTSFRIDAEYFQHQFVDVVKIIERCSFSYIDEIASWVTQGPNPIFSKQGIPCLTGRNINKGSVSYNNADYVDDDEYNKLSRYQLKTGDTLITLKGKGSIGKIGYVTSTKPSIFSRDIGIIRPSNINSGYLNVFILSKYGKLLVDRGETGGTGQSTLTTSYLKSIPVPRFNIEYKIGDTLNQVEDLIKKSQKEYQQAQNLLLNELGLNDWQPKHQLSFIKNFSDTREAARIDAEYFQPKYDEIINAIKSYQSGWDTLGGLVKIKKGVEVGSGKYLDKGIPFVRVSNLGPFEITEEKYISEVLYAMLTPAKQNITFEKSKNHQPQQGEILLSKDASPGIANYLKDQSQKMIVSGGILRLKSTTEKVGNEYLTLVLNSVLVQEQIKRDVGGSIILHWRPEQVKGTIIPILPQEKQQEIQQKVTESFELRKQSKRLLENAKRAVEIAIEQDEDSAMTWLEKSIPNLPR